MVVGGNRVSNKWCRENIYMEKRETKFRAGHCPAESWPCVKAEHKMTYLVGYEACITA